MSEIIRYDYVVGDGENAHIRPLSEPNSGTLKDFRGISLWKINNVTYDISKCGIANEAESNKLSAVVRAICKSQGVTVESVVENVVNPLTPKAGSPETLKVLEAFYERKARYNAINRAQSAA